MSAAHGKNEYWYPTLSKIYEIKTSESCKINLGHLENVSYMIPIRKELVWGSVGESMKLHGTTI